jgi:hypothetical protein
MNSPTVSTTEQNKSYYQPNFTNEIAAYVGYFEKGPINTPTFITDINEFKFIFGRGLDFCHNDWYQVYNYLQYASGIWVVRASGNQQYNANNGDIISINSLEEFQTNYDEIELEYDIRVISKVPGEAGNLLSVAFIRDTSYNQNKYVGHGYYSKDLFTYMENDQTGMVVFRNGNIVEKFQILDDDLGEISTLSKYVYVKIKDNTDFFNYIDEELITLSKGSTNFASDEDFKNAHDILKNKDQYYIDIIIGNEYANEYAIEVSEDRKDCIAFIGIPTRFITFLEAYKNEEAEVLYTEDGLVIATSDFSIPKNLGAEDFERLYEYINGLNESQFVHFTANIKHQIDGFTGKTKLVNIAGDIAGLKSKASLISPWTPSAGLERGIILNGEDIHIKFSENQKTAVYTKGLNFIDGGIIMTQRTFLSTPSSFSRINVRCIFNHLEKTVQRILRNYVFEENRVGVRRTIALEVKNILNDMKSNRGIEAGKVHVKPSESNESEIIVDIYIKPTYVSEYIQLRMNNVGSNTISSILSNTLG